MNRPIQFEVEMLIDHLKLKINSPVYIGWPQGTEHGLYVFPYSVNRDVLLRNAAPNRMTTSDRENIHLNVSVVVMTNPESDLSLLGEAITVIHASPQLGNSSLLVHVEMLDVPIQDSTQLFMARNAPLRPCVFYSLKSPSI